MYSKSNSTVVKTQRCPRCAKDGRDRKGNNLAIYNDGHSYCYGCGYYKSTTVTSNTMKKKLYKMALTSDIEPDFSMENFTSKLPAAPLQWLDSYGVTEQERIVNRICYDLDKDLLVFPVFDGDRLVVTNCRYFGSNPEYPKYITKGWKSGHFKLFPKDNNVFILTEDFISALKVGRLYNAIPLLGTSFPRELLFSLLGKCPRLRIWLDRDKAHSSISMAQKARQWIADCASIITEKDPKDYLIEQIKEFVSASLLQPAKSLSKE